MTSIEAIRAEREYTLSYHEIFARTEPRFLDAYAHLYRTFTLDQRHLPARERELVWVGILVADEEAVGTLHLERARAAGLTEDEVGDAVSIAGVVAAWPSLAFAGGTWQHALSLDVEARYDVLVTAAAPRLSARERDLIAIATHAVYQHAAAFLLHLRRLYAVRTPEEHIAEAISYLLLPCGANAMLWATDQWLRAIEDGVVPAGELLAGVNTETRRR